MTLTVRLKPDLESALEHHCAVRGVTKSLVVQQVLTAYLAHSGKRRGSRRQATPVELAEPSANYRAFEALGLMGAVDLGGRSADKARVREVIAERMAARKAVRKRP